MRKTTSFRFIGLMLCLLAIRASSAQSLRAGFSIDEYRTLLSIDGQHGDSVYQSKIPQPIGYERLYLSPEVGLQNRWALWMNDNRTAVISLRGTVNNMTSWLANFHAAMVPAKGSIQIAEGRAFDYNLAEHPQAAIHVGWLIGIASLAETILPKLDSIYRAGTREAYITGHSQGGALSYLLTAFLLGRQRDGLLPSDMRFKTYCSAAPKPGNLFFAYDYEGRTQGGWAFNVVNAADWVPETPMSIQTLQDFNAVNPFVGAKSTIRRAKAPLRWALKHAFNRLDKPSRRTVKNYRKYLGKTAGKLVRKELPGYALPEFLPTNNYVRTGQFIILQPDKTYVDRFPDDPKQVFLHHMHEAYFFLLDRLVLQR